MEKIAEEWTSTGIKSVFKLSLEAFLDRGQWPTSVGAGTQSTVICGFGWRFSFQVDAQPASSPVVDNAGNRIESFQLQLFFDPYLIREGAYGAITLTTQLKNLISQEDPAPVTLTLPPGYRQSGSPSLGKYVYPSNASTPSISITVSFSATLGLTLPHSLEPQMERALEETLAGKELVDIKFYAFSRRGSECVTHPLPLFANSGLLQGFSKDLDNLLIGHGFSESAAVDLDMHEPEEHSFDDYGYDSDSDLESEAGDSEQPATSVDGSLADGIRKTDSTNLSGKGMRMGRVIVLKDTAFKTWKALLYYLYTKQVNFRPLKSEGTEQIAVSGPTCSPKSMYRLADKLGLEDLRVLALASISSRLSENNILQEVFSFYSSVYPVIQDLEIGILASNFSDKASEGLKEISKAICEGEKPYCADTLFKVIRKMGGK
ncbi:hypothetical protein MVEN_01958200 [Mycena venus]|uniref:BTB domain-containing protein n=1 Tax=Mycena venus TaxID=2733690 RepID=A0A8H6XH32_9AGAR|nr:hypothetical protein MVEN_01958200 [Mycena venus]